MPTAGGYAIALPIKRGKGKAIPAVFASLRSSEFTNRLETALGKVAAKVI
ncbi:MAG: hypothetical protein HWQ23_15110 [Nostoc sp. JL33]|nr:hypothetical protein [Nostoc sp. JL33]MBN3871553.1 hypothetical protein [Nostoc sp. JL33]